MKAIIIDDEKRARVSLSLLLQEYCKDIELVAECENLPEGVKAIRKYKPDLVLLDIEMPGYSGLELLDFFNENEIDFSIIFTTAYNEYAIQAFKLSAIDYLLKPIIPEELVQAVNRLEKHKSQQYKALVENMQQENFEKIAVPSGSSLILLNLADIMYIKGEGAYSEVYMTDNTKHLVSRNLKNFEDILNKDNRFIRTHKSYIVNFNEVSSYNKSDGGWLVLKNNATVPVSIDKGSLIMDRIQIVKR
jgi:two-component system, LytTR family, response regulator